MDRDDLLQTPDGPPAPKPFPDTQVVPFTANMAGGFEVALGRLRRRKPIVVRRHAIAGHDDRLRAR